MEPMKLETSGEQTGMDDNNPSCSISHASRRERRRTETREIIYEAAMKLFSERHFETVTIEMITESADVGKGTFYKYFDNKEAVIGYDFDTKLRLFTLASSKLLAGAEIENYPNSAKYFPKTGGLFWRRMVALVKFIAEHQDRNRNLTRTFLSLSLTNPVVRVASGAMKHQVTAIMVELLQEGLNRGELRSDFTADEMAVILYGAHLSAMVQWAQSEEEIPLTEAIDRTYSQLWKGLRSPNWHSEEDQL